MEERIVCMFDEVWILVHEVASIPSIGLLAFVVSQSLLRGQNGKQAA